MSKIRFEIKITDRIDARLAAINEHTGMERSQIMLAALANYMPEIQPTQAKRTRRQRVEVTLGEGNKPKKFDEVVEFFRSKKLPEPIEQKARLFYDYYETNGWVQGKGKPIKMWGSCLTTWLQNNPNWRPVPTTPKEEVDLEEFLEWAKESRPPIFQKYRGAKNINEVDQLYIDEFSENNK
jgi:hypothetical protein